jgi:outer membrane protein
MKYLIATIVLLLLPICSAFSDEKTKVISLNECINIAIHNNPLIFVSEEDKKRALAEYKAANAQRNIAINAEIKSHQYPKVAKSWKFSDWDPIIGYLPGLSEDEKFAYSYARYKYYKKSSNLIDNLSEYYTLGISFGINVGVTLYSEKNNRLVDQAKSGMKLADLQAKKTISDIIYNVKRSYYSYMLSHETVLLQEKLVKYNEDRMRLTEVFYKNAQRQLYDLTKAKYDLSDSQLQLQKAKNAEYAARIDFLRSLGITDTGTDFILEKKDNLPELQYTLEELYKLGDLSYPDIQIARMQKEITKIKVAVEKAGHYPDVSLQLGAAYENGQLDKSIFDSQYWKPTFAAGFVARIPIYSGGMVSARIDSAETEYNKMVYKEKDALTNMQLTLQSNYNTLKELTKQLETTKLLMENSEKNYKIALRTYESGATTMLELNDSNAARINSQLSYLKVRNDYLMTIAKISSIVGLGEDALCKK